MATKNKRKQTRD